MGSGQGLAGILGLAASKPGRIMFEIDGVTPTVAKESLRPGAPQKLPIKTSKCVRAPGRRRAVMRNRRTFAPRRTTN